MSNHQTQPSSPALVDVNVSWGTWPFQRFADASLEDLERRLAESGIVEAYVSHIGGILNADSRSFNLELIRDVSGLNGLHAVPVVNPMFPGWAEHLDLCRHKTAVKAVKLYPAHHNYSLVDDEFVDPLVDYLIAYNITPLICVRVEDERTRYHGLSVVGHPIDDVIAFGNRYSDVRPICLNAYLPEARRLGQETETVGVDTAFVDWMFAFEELLRSINIERVYFGSHSPFLYTGASVDKLMLSRLTDAEKRAIGTNGPGRIPALTTD